MNSNLLSRPPRWVDALQQSVRGIRFVAIVFCCSTLVLLAVNARQMRIGRVLNHPELEKWLQQYRQHPDDQAVRETIRLLDLQIRRAFFSSQRFAHTGALFLLVGAGVLFASLQVEASLGWRPKCPGALFSPETSLRHRAWSRWSTAAFGGCCVAAASVFLLIGRKNSDPHQGVDFHSSRVSRPAAAQRTSLPSREAYRTNWPAFRGWDGQGVAYVRPVPRHWNGQTGLHIAWKVPVPRAGHSSPVIWGNRVFLTGADAQQQEVFCFDLSSGTLLWRQSVGRFPGSPDAAPKVLEETGYAASTPVADEHRVYAIFASGDLAALDWEGRLIWGKNIGVPDNPYGHASSLRAYGGRVIVQFDDNANPRVVALNGVTGKEHWSIKRAGPSWASPIWIERDNRLELIVAGKNAVDAYDPETGKRLWTCPCLSGDVAPSPAFGAGIVYVANEGAGAFAISPPSLIASSDIKPIWQADEHLPDVASPVADEHHVVFATSGGTLACRDTTTGELKWKQDFDTGFYASPIRVGDLVYATDREGVTRIFTLGPAFSGVTNCPLGEPCQATPAMVSGRIVLRGEKHLFCIGEGSTAHEKKNNTPP